MTFPKRLSKHRVKDTELTEAQLAQLYSTYPEHLVVETVTEWMSGAAMPQEVRVQLGAWANAWATQTIPEGVPEIGHRVAVYMARQIAEGADLRDANTIKVGKRRSEKPRHAMIARDVYLLAKPRGTMSITAAARKVAAKWCFNDPEDVRQIYYKYRDALAVEFGQ